MTDVFVVGSIGQDFVLRVERRPKPVGTVTGTQLSIHSGGKGANQAAAAALLGASVAFLRQVGDDEFGKPLARALRGKGVDASLAKQLAQETTVVAFITVTPDGVNAIMVAPGANRCLTPEDVDAASAVIRDAWTHDPDRGSPGNRQVGGRDFDRRRDPRAGEHGSALQDSADLIGEARSFGG